ncbi:MAG: hypothetical protein CMI03_03415 [Oceanospirillaceae bacterium]|uniref:roadblock/LC7 domain-containing protein n=1 Tax=unclassified Thalassolituus TaxID=2624967 RepID=UPI000C6855EA|nr:MULTISPECIES: roadblock/LC7 domain-containing protein [unclassified Thalassolituus]MBL34468.1 hypothetical protein [Oceanospirillaceae bacterium]MBS51782.1 hypothetical protein [Oceanospirillaceae bacterium]|tara:strand:+ start:5182 stop:5604 length:423 start_codon:yes stop_codon:yes gene_type:complete
MNEAVNPLVSNTLKAAFVEQLKSASARHSGIEYLSMSTSDGYVLCNTIAADSAISAERLAAMSASFCGISNGLTEQAEKQPFTGCLIETEKGLLVCRPIQHAALEVVLLGSFSPETNHGVAMWTLNNVARDILEILKHYN